MKADEIRGRIAYAQDRGNEKVGFDQEQHIQWQQAVMLSEIAAQLAELNEPPAPINASPTKWAQFKTPSERHVCIIPTLVTSVRQIPNGECGPSEVLCEIVHSNGNVVIVRGTYAEVCAKLGIPVEG